MGALVVVWLAGCVPRRAAEEEERGGGDVVAADRIGVVDTEPNDRPDAASGLEAGRGRGTLGRGDVDYFSTPAGVALWRLEVRAEPADGVRVDVLSPARPLPEVGEARTVIQAGRGERALVLLRPTGAEPVDYVIHVQPLDLPDVGALLAEPNDPSDPGELNRVPSRAAGFYDGAGDRDGVSIAAARFGRGGAVTVEVAPVVGLRPLLRILTGTGAELARLGAERPGEGVGIPNLGAPDGLDRLIFEVSEADGRTADRPYTLSLHRPERPVGDVLELEPDDTPDYAGRISGSVSVAGFFHRADDVDLYRLVVDREGAVSIALLPDGSTDAALRWMPEQGETLPADLAGPGQAEQLCARQVRAGEHLIEVAPRSMMGPALAQYRLTTRVEAGTFEREPNDQPAADALQVVEDEVRGYIESPADVDVFGLRLFAPVDAAMDRDVGIEVAPPRDIDVAIEVLDDVGASVVAPTDRVGPGQAERVSVPWVTTTYRIRITGGRGGGSGCESAYTLRLVSE